MQFADMLTCPPLRSRQPTQFLPSRLYLILYLWANSFPMPSAWRPCVPTSVMKCSERRSTWRYSLRSSGSNMMSGHQAPSPSPLSESSLQRRERRREGRTQKLLCKLIHDVTALLKGKPSRAVVLKSKLPSKSCSSRLRPLTGSRDVLILNLPTAHAQRVATRFCKHTRINL